MPSISELITLARGGDEQAMQRLIVAYQARVAAMVISVIGDDEEWEDVCQQIFVKMVLGLRRLKKLEVFEPWLFRIARNSALDHLRRRRARRLFVPWQRSHEAIADETRPDLNPHHAALDEAIAQLPADQRDLLTLVLDRHCSYSYLTAITGESVAAIKSRLFRARQRLRQLMTAL